MLCWIERGILRKKIWDLLWLMRAPEVNMNISKTCFKERASQTMGQLHRSVSSTKKEVGKRLQVGMDVDKPKPLATMINRYEEKESLF
jgi:hypothetical protein